MRLFFACPKGATAIEYAVIAALIAIAMLASLSLVGNKTANSYNNVANKVNKAM